MTKRVIVYKYLNFHCPHYNANLSVDGRPKRREQMQFQEYLD